jgi:hypothetical protein
LLKAAQVAPRKANDLSKDSWTLFTQGQILKYLFKTGDRPHAREQLKRLEKFVEDAIKTSKDRSDGLFLLREFAGCQAAAADFDGAFATVERLRKSGFDGQHGAAYALGKIAEGTEFLKPLEMRRFIRRVAEELEKIKDSKDTYFALSDLAQAQAWLGDYHAARKSALAIGLGGPYLTYDATDGQPYALLRVAIVQMRAGDIAGARETLRLGYECVRKYPTMRIPSERLDQIAQGQIGAGDMQGALMSAMGMKPGERWATLARIAQAQAIAGLPEQARETMSQALDDAGLDPDGRVNRPASPPPGPRRPQYIMGKIAEVQAMAGRTDAALTTARGIKDQGFRGAGLERIVESRARAGELAEALRLTRELDSRRAGLEQFADGLSERLELEQSWRQARCPQQKP